MTKGVELRTWVRFLAGGDVPALAIAGAEGVTIDRYVVEAVMPTIGELPPSLTAGMRVLRLECQSPHGLPVTPVAAAGIETGVRFDGVTRHLQYTSAVQRRELDARSRTSLRPSDRTTAVLIPIGKSAAWWQTAQDERNAHFQRNGTQPGHTAIGLDYADRIFRKLYHSRDLPAASGYHFLTYFEFDREDAPLFRKLLGQLRDIELNPEWRYVDLEFEIWMTKIG